MDFARAGCSTTRASSSLAITARACRDTARSSDVFLYEETLHVPLLVSWPGKIRAGSKVNALCGLADVANTILDLMGESVLPQSDGDSLKPLLDRVVSAMGADAALEKAHCDYLVALTRAIGDAPR